MAELTYSIGTVSVAANDTAVTGSGTLWESVNARQWDWISIDGGPLVPITDIADATHLTLALPSAEEKTDVAYVIYQVSPLRFAGGQAMADVSELIARLRAKGLMWYLPAGYTKPQDVQPPLTADDGQSILRVDTHELWVMQGGSWVSAGTYNGVTPRGEWGPGAYNANDIVSHGGAAYMALTNTEDEPPSADWMDLGAAGEAATVEVGTVTTGAPGSAASVTNSGDEHAAVLDFTIPTGKGYGGTSATELTIGTGNHTFAIDAGLAFVAGDRVHIGATSAPLNWMEGFVTAYAGTSMTVAVGDVGGSGTFDAWGIGLTGKPGTGDGDMKAAVYDPIIDDLANGQSGNAAAISAVSGGVTALQSYVLQRKFSGCMIYRNSDSSAIFASGAITKVPFTHASYDYDNWWDISDDDDFWVPDLPGLVAVKCTASLFVANGDASGAASETRFAVNGSVPIGGGFDVRSDGGRFYLVSAIFPGLSYGDKISLEFYHTAGKSLAVAATYTWAAVEGIFSPE